MNSMKHTPGLWHVSAFDSETGTPAEISGAGGEPICSLHRRNPDNAANAQTILAAPELFDALLAMLDYYDYDGAESHIKGTPCKAAHALMTRISSEVQP